MADADTNVLETKADAGNGSKGEYKLWMKALSASGKDEEDWRKEATRVEERFRDEKRTSTGNRSAKFNILFANTETLCPAIYNSTPKPDVRRRFRDKSPVTKIAAQVLERCLSFTLDSYDFSNVMESCVHDAEVVGRGIPLVSYQPTFDDKGQVAWEAAECEHVDWQDFRRGPGRRWVEVMWLAVRYRLTREEAKSLLGDVGAKADLDYVSPEVGNADKDVRKIPDTFKRLTVWKIWDKATREIVFIAPSYTDGPAKKEKDKLGLQNFFPIPYPFYDIFDPNSLIPLIPYKQYEDQARELDKVTGRINALIAVMKWRGITDSSLNVTELLKDAADGEIVPADNLHQIIANAGLDKAIWMMPIERVAEILDKLYLQRDQIKQTIYEITGVADVMRGQTDASETLGAQQLKAQWGSLRLQSRQRQVQRLARDVIRMKAEIIAEHFSPQTLQAMSGIELPTKEDKQAAQMAQQQAAQAQAMPQQPGMPQAPQAQPAMPEDKIKWIAENPTWEEVIPVLRSDALRSYSVDIETDSTIQADQNAAQQAMAQFVQGTASFVGAFAPILEAGVIPADAVVDIYTAFARQFKLGKQAEDALDRLGEEAREAQKKPKPPSPEEIKAKSEEQRTQAELQGKQMDAQNEQAKMQADAQIKGQQAQADEQRAQREFEMRMAELQATHQMAREKHEMDMAAKALDIEGKKQAHEQGMAHEEVKQRGAINEAVANSVTGEDGQPTDVLSKIASAAESLAQAAQSMEAIAESSQKTNEAMLKAVASPKRARKMPDGSYVSEPMAMQ